jgi:DMSO/TMAO reductase YedYZ molybdopterin-dependent catalytic subunit
MITLEPSGFFRRVPLQPYQLTDRHTRTEDSIVLCHLGVPRIAPHDWSLTIDGLVRRPLRLEIDDLKQRKKVRIESVHQCAGSPLQPRVPTRRVCSVIWTGVPLADLLSDCEPLETARFAWAYGADYGTFEGYSCDAYVKDLPLERVSQDVLLAYEMNDAPLRPENGFPVRLVVPGFYGTNSVKWLTRLKLCERRADGPFTTALYNDPVLDGMGAPTGATRPVWEIAPESVIVTPAPGSKVPFGLPVQIWGWAWGDGDISCVEVSRDGGCSWSIAKLEPRAGRMWQRFQYTWLLKARGSYDICSRAAGPNGEFQPASGARNAIHQVAIEVIEG